MKVLTLFLLVMIMASNAEARELACTLGGAVIELNDNGTYNVAIGNIMSWDIGIWMTVGAVGGMLSGVGMAMAEG